MLLAPLLLAAPVAMSGDRVVCVDVPVAIPDNNPDGVAVSLDVGNASGLSVTQVRLDLVATHPWVGDLRVVLTAPSGAMVVLLDRPGMPSVGFPGPFGCGGDNIDATFIDSATADAESTCSTTLVPVLSDPLRPLEPLAAFEGGAAEGVWTLTVADLSVADAGTLVSVCLTLSTAPACPADLAEPFGSLNFFDLAAFLSLFQTGDPAADLAAPTGVFNFFDLSAYLSLYNAGCP
tara:strand:+ start:8693 stop:9394 length:702 start_codon:yes stop_codon:yes gene_type:complete